LRGSLNAVIFGRSFAAEGSLRKVYNIKSKDFTDYYIIYTNGEFLTSNKQPVSNERLQPDIVVEKAIGAPGDQIMESAVDYLKKPF